MQNHSATAPRPYTGLRIIELGGGLAANFCTKLFADFGADVTKVEGIGGDPLRVSPPLAETASGQMVSGLALFLNENKRSICLDLDTPTGEALFLTLIERADAVVDARDFTEDDPLPAAATVRKPGLVWTRITPFGLTGPRRDWSGSDLVYQAVSASMYGWGRADRPPLRAPGLASEYLTGACSAAVLAASLRSAPGVERPTMIDVSQASTQLLVAVLDITRCSYLGAIPHRVTVPFPGIAACADGYVGINLLTDDNWRSFCVMMGRPDLQDNPRFANPRLRLVNTEALAEVFGPLLLQWTKNDLFDTGSKRYQIPISPVITPAEIPTMPHLVERGYFIEREVPGLGRLPLPGPYVRMSESAWAMGEPASACGAHTAAILGELGLAPDEVEQLIRQGVAA